MSNSAFNQQVPLSQQPRTPGGRLTLTTATPVMSSEAASQTTIYYTPYVNDQIPIYDGSGWINKTFTEISLAMAASANWAADTNYDLYIVNDGGTLRLGTGAAWTNATTRSESLTRVNGIYTNAASMTLRYAAASTLVAAANTATYVGTMRTTASAGTTTWELGGKAAGGDPGFLYLWNCYNRTRVDVRVQEGTDSWVYTTATFRAAQNSASNAVSFVMGLSEDAVEASYMAHSANSSANVNQVIAIGLDSTSTPSGDIAAGAPPANSATPATVVWRGFPGLGKHTLTALEYSVATGATTWYGDAGVTYLQSGFSFSGMF